MSKFLLIYSLMIGLSYAGWSDESKSLLTKQIPKFKHLTKPGFVTVWAGTIRALKDSALKGDYLDYDLTGLMKTKKLEVYTYHQEKDGELTVFFPGVFGKGSGGVSKSLVHDIEMSDTSILNIPNFLSTNYIEAQPMYDGNPIEVDVKVQVRIIKSFIKKHKYKITKINLIGESLGSYMVGGLIPYFNTDSILKEFEYSIFMGWPPLTISKTVGTIDSYITKYQKTYDDCSYVMLFPKFIYHFYIQEVPKDMSKDFASCLETVMFNGVFISQSNRSYSSFKDVSDKDDDKEITKFMDLFKRYNPAMFELVDKNHKEGQLSYWLKMRRPSVKVRIISSVNDFVNDDANWDLFLKESNVDIKDVFMLPWGSHSGGYALDGWGKLFKNEIFSN